MRGYSNFNSEEYSRYLIQRRQNFYKWRRQYRVKQSKLKTLRAIVRLKRTEVLRKQYIVKNDKIVRRDKPVCQCYICKMRNAN